MEAETEEIKRELAGIMKDRVVFALVYGSILKPSFNAQSDVDVAVYLDKRDVAFQTRLDIYTILQEVLNRDVDVVILDNADLIITMRVLANGELIVNNNPEAFIRFKALKIGQYLDFKMSRKIIEDQMLGGRIYA